MGRKINKYLYSLLSSIRKRAKIVLVFVRKNPRQILRYSAVMLLIVFVITTLTAKLSSNQYANDVQQARAQLQQIQDQVASLLPPERIELGQQDLSVDYLLSQTKPGVFKPQPVDTPSRTMITINLLPNTSYHYSAFNDVKRLRKNVVNLATHQHTVFSALESVLEYNPRADFADKTLNEEEIKLRIENTRSGLASAADSLQNKTDNKIDDPSKDKLISSVNTLQQKLELFSKNRDMNAWFTTVETEQKAIINNRQSLWTTEINKIYNQISEINQDLADTEKALRS